LSLRSLMSHPYQSQKGKCVALGKYLDVAKAVNTKKHQTGQSECSGRQDVGVDDDKRSRDKSDISDQSPVRSERVRRATLTVGEVLEDINRPNTGAAIQAEHYRRGSISKENAVEWVTKAILVRRDLDTAGWERHAPAVEAALTHPLGCDCLECVL